MIRIYADFNHRDELGRILLDTVGSLHDIQNYASELSEGLNVVLYMEDDVELEGRLLFDGVWMAVPELTTVRHVRGDNA